MVDVDNTREERRCVLRGCVLALPSTVAAARTSSLTQNTFGPYLVRFVSRPAGGGVRRNYGNADELRLHDRLHLRRWWCRGDMGYRIWTRDHFS